ncbi:MAG TPA: NAD(P)-binding domain-containing protein [Gaiellaceae bacterium]|nr:NAD(P)-binding domain-containing protein [Gaiellaceae bacterium]
MAGVEGGGQPFPPGDYGVVVVGSGPGALQTAYCLDRLGIDHAVISADDAPGGMFARMPIFERLISPTKPSAPFERTSRDYERYDHNSLLAEEEDARGLVPEFMDRSFDVPSRAEMHMALQAFAERARVRVRYGCRWESTRREDDGALVLATGDGEYRCRAAVFAIGVTEPWKPKVPGFEDVPHYAETRPPREYEGRRVAIIGKRNSGFEIANGLLPWAREVVMLSPRPVNTSSIALLPIRTRYLQPFDEYARGLGGAYVLDAAIERVDRVDGAFRVVAQGTTKPGPLSIEADDVIIATGFRTPLLDLPELGVETVSDGRIPALTPFFESIGAPGIYFAGNASGGAAGLLKVERAGQSTSVNGFRYNARLLAQRIAERHFDRPRERSTIEPASLIQVLLDELAHSPELWVQRGYLARVISFEDGPHDEGYEPLTNFVDATGPDAVAAAVELAPDASIAPVLYVRRGGNVTEHQLAPHPLHAYETDDYRAELEHVLAALVRVAA